ncbi:hypothetical protein BD289DRAFT_14866 [Coniella lustricola]|uniref:Uncharacterized protein n=1 Tax=Coniella lustricola TaxID=2025994 RepID=A0A2T3A463_9PEZI|nr:hypothetical protein BD289DRAFT_14866 [Coniella lustricola]
MRAPATTQPVIVLCHCFGSAGRAISIDCWSAGVLDAWLVRSLSPRPAQRPTSIKKTKKQKKKKKTERRKDRTDKHPRRRLSTCPRTSSQFWSIFVAACRELQARLVSVRGSPAPQGPSRLHDAARASPNLLEGALPQALPSSPGRLSIAHANHMVAALARGQDDSRPAPCPDLARSVPRPLLVLITTSRPG